MQKRANNPEPPHDSRYPTWKAAVFRGVGLPSDATWEEYEVNFIKKVLLVHMHYCK